MAATLQQIVTRGSPLNPTGSDETMTFVIESSAVSVSRPSLPSKIYRAAMIFPFPKAMDRHVERQFRKAPGGRLVFLPHGRKGKAYFVDSKSDEEKIKAFVKMYRSAGALISWVAYLSFYVWIVGFNTGAHRWTTEVGIASFFFLLLLVPVWMLWYLYKQTVPGFTSSLSEVGPELEGLLSEISPPLRRLRGPVLVSLFASILVLGIALIFLTRRPAPGKAACPPKCASSDPVSR